LVAGTGFRRGGLGPAGGETGAEQHDGGDAAEPLTAGFAVSLAEATVDPHSHRHEDESKGDQQKRIVVILGLAREHPQ
jgi:hypothetical protein